MNIEISDQMLEMQPTPEERICFDGMDLIGTVEAADTIGWSAAKFAIYHSRGRTPSPVGFVGGRPAWTRRQILLFKDMIQGK